MKKTLVVNLFAGPGAGKTTCAWAIAAELKKRNINTEYVPEYAKELVWDGNYTALENQEALFKEQSHRINRLIGKVDIIVTDSPILLSEIYGKNNSNEFNKRILAEHNSHKNFNIFVKRGKYFEQAGRIQNLEQSVQIDERIKNMLKDHSIYYGTYTHDLLPIIVHNIVITLKRISREKSTETKKLIGTATHWGKLCKFYYNGSRERQTIEHPDGTVEYMASRPETLEWAVAVAKYYWKDFKETEIKPTLDERIAEAEKLQSTVGAGEYNRTINLERGDRDAKEI